MTTSPLRSAFDVDRLIGTVCEVAGTTVKLNLPRAATTSAASHHGGRVDGGQVGEYVVIESGRFALFGKVVLVRLPERERLTVEPGSARSDAHPIGTVQLLANADLVTGRVSVGLIRFPRLGERVFSAHPDVVIAMTCGSHAVDADGVSLDIATLSDLGATVSVTPESLFGRHCAVVGSTGGGKSWTVARLIEQMGKHNAKVVLLDATGEFLPLTTSVRHIHIGTSQGEPQTSENVSVPYHQLTVDDLFAIFKPGGQSQSPKLRLAIKTLKIAALEPSVGSSGVVHKAGQLKSKLSQAYKKHQAAVDGPGARFDINKLAEQIDLECVWRDDKSGDPKRWGGVQENDRSYCAGLINRVEEIVHAPEMACVMQPGALRSFGEALDEFFKDGEVRTLRVSMQHVPFAHSAREIVANTIGRHLLALGRTGAYKSKPLLVVVDEAHQFFGKSIGDEYTRCTLDAFELIAKEGRKYALTLCIATQRPRDITEDVLSQMGTLIVHRLVNDSDREVVERATSSLDASASGFLPSLGQGEALIVGAAFTVPLMVQMMAPTEPPESRGPDYQTHWKIVPA